MEREKQIFFDQEARFLLLDGMQAGYEVALKHFNNYKVISSFELENPILDTGLSFIRQIATTMHEQYNDGTSLAALLLYKLTEASIESKTHLEELISHLEKQISYLTGDLLFNYILNCSQNHHKIASTIYEAVTLAENHGIIIEESQNSETLIEKTHGLQLDSISISPALDGTLKEPNILILEKTLSSSLDIIPLLEIYNQSNNPLLIIAEGIDNDALSTLVFHKIQKNLPICAVKVSGFGETHKKHLEEIYHLTGASQDMLGKAQKIHVEKDKLTLIHGDNYPLFCIKLESTAPKSIYIESLQKTKSALKQGVFLDLASSFSSIPPTYNNLTTAFHNFPQLPVVNAHVAINALKYAWSLSHTINSSKALIMESKP